MDKTGLLPGDSTCLSCSQVLGRYEMHEPFGYRGAEQILETQIPWGLEGRS